tara:strand:+ start:2678 stop:3940 length:1263 start_codon:yes stop_codon:yes gene_type:complete
MIKKFFFILFILLSFITQTIAEPGKDVILSRLTFSDIFGALGLVFGLKVLYTGFINANQVSKIYQASLFMVFCFFAPILFSYNIQSTIVECLILLFLVFMSVGIYKTFKEDFLSSLLPLIIYTMITASVLGYYDLLASVVGLPRIFPKRTDGEALSGFRNAGQAGAYFLVNLTILIPLRFSKLFYLLRNRDRKLLNIALLLSIIFIALTGKIAAYIGLLIGVFMYIVYKRNAKQLVVLIIATIGLVVLWNNLESYMPDTYNRINSKYNSRILGTIENRASGGFIENNYGEAIQSFTDRPLIGSGMGGFIGRYGKHEVHSTYLKMLGETGILGTLGYAIFLLSFLRLFRFKKHRKQNPYADYLWAMYPFILGCLISWSYTYHLRKREFWILLTVILISNYAARQYSLNEQKCIVDELPKNI